MGDNNEPCRQLGQMGQGQYLIARARKKAGVPRKRAGGVGGCGPGLWLWVCTGLSKGSFKDTDAQAPPTPEILTSMA